MGDANVAGSAYATGSLQVTLYPRATHPGIQQGRPWWARIPAPQDLQKRLQRDVRRRVCCPRQARRRPCPLPARGRGRKRHGRTTDIHAPQHVRLCCEGGDLWSDMRKRKRSLRTPIPASAGPPTTRVEAMTSGQLALQRIRGRPPWPMHSHGLALHPRILARRSSVTTSTHPGALRARSRSPPVRAAPQRRSSRSPELSWVSTRGLADARASPAGGPRGRWRRRRHLERLPFMSASFDLVTAAGAINYTDLDVSLPEIARTLTSTGIFVIYDFQPVAGSPIGATWK